MFNNKYHHHKYHKNHHHHKNRKILNKSHLGEKFIESIIFILFTLTLVISVYKYKGYGPFVERTLETNALEISSDGVVILNPDNDNEFELVSDESKIISSFEIVGDDSSKLFEINSYNTFKDFSTDIIFSKKNETVQGEILGRIISSIDEETTIDNITIIQNTPLGEDPEGIILFDNNSIEIDSRGLIRSQSFIPSISYNCASCLGINHDQNEKNNISSYIQILNFKKSQNVSLRNATYIIPTWPNYEYDEKQDAEVILPSLKDFNNGDSLIFLFSGDLYSKAQFFFFITKISKFTFSCVPGETILANSVIFNNQGGGITTEVFFSGNDCNDPSQMKDLNHYNQSTFVISDQKSDAIALVNKAAIYYPASDDTDIQKPYSSSGSFIKFIKTTLGTENDSGNSGWSVEAETYSNYSKFIFISNYSDLKNINYSHSNKRSKSFISLL